MINNRLKNPFNKNLLPLYSIISGTNFWKKYKILLRNQWLPREKLELIQNYKLQRLINYSYYKVPFYNNLFKNLNLKPTDIKKVEDLTLLPAINKEIISENFSELFSVDAKKKDFIISQTSGTTQDNRFKYVESKSSYGWRKAAFYRQYVGYQFDSSLLRYMDPEKFNHHSLKSKILDLSINHTWDYIDIDKEEPGIVESKLNRIINLNPAFIKGRPSSLVSLAKLLNERKRKIKPNCIYTNGENLFEGQRIYIQDIFECKVLDMYGGEGGISAFECGECNGYHTSIDCGVFEVVNPNSYTEVSKLGDLGVVLGTDLNNYTMPLIRYEIGDVVFQASKNNKLRCERGLPLIDKIGGRKSNTFTVNNKLISEKHLDLFLSKSFNFDLISKIQIDVNSGFICFLKNANYQNNFMQEVSKMVEKEYRIKTKIKLINNLESTPSGKRQLIINR